MHDTIKITTKLAQMPFHMLRSEADTEGKKEEKSGGRPFHTTKR